MLSPTTIRRVAVATFLLYVVIFGRQLVAIGWRPADLGATVFLRHRGGHFSWEINEWKIGLVATAILVYAFVVVLSMGVKSASASRFMVIAGVAAATSLIVVALSWGEVGLVLSHGRARGDVERRWLEWLLLPRRTLLGFLWQLLIAAVCQVALVSLVTEALRRRTSSRRVTTTG